ncbi:MOSC N-terminal beta barrel domain-containing protein [Emericellopsis atlantica]|uniref:Molybdenum cofactor sulfurase n=1 Tax=Emericellopsis atlantica TaxID=2614577 RepID=A0A9P7ZSW4_9HYPO|nr:MOSC N-terminal beta barrel domain-containing protein [Emericellopsis atlantica]KAG9257043.1 MOSC N-terminal beta barrel domain-containing protein [Emericellopsis atlantica]
MEVDFPWRQADEYDEGIERMRKIEYPMLQDATYLDHAGTTLPAKSFMETFAQDMILNLYGNPHSASGPSQRSADRIENVRSRLLTLFNADPSEYDLVFVSNTTAGVKLVSEGMRSLPGGFNFAHHQACHTSLVGVREEAQHARCFDDEDAEQLLQGGASLFDDCADTPDTLVAFTAQSHFDGKRYPLTWARDIRDCSPASQSRTYTLLDAASLAATSPLDLSDHDRAPDFTVLSLYKLFGFPDVGVLIVRLAAGSVFSRRKYFGGGTVDMVITGKEQWHAPKMDLLHERLEDGTLPFHNIISVEAAIDTHQVLYGSMAQVSSHTSRLRKQLVNGLHALEHGNGNPLCKVYGEAGNGADFGPIVSFNLRNIAGAWLSLAEFDKIATLKQMHVRTGGMCSPGGLASALCLQPWEMKRNFSAGLRCGTDSDLTDGKPSGVIRVSFGAMSTASDVTRFLDFLKDFFIEDEPPNPTIRTTLHASSRGLQVKSLSVFPIKSCGPFEIPPGVRWEVKREGLAWDREWCLVHRGSGQALSQKRYPQMALLKPELDFEQGTLRISCRGTPQLGSAEVPLSLNPDLFEDNPRQISSRVCGESISTHYYKSQRINSFFSEALGIPCTLARFPAGGKGSGSRSSKARIQQYQQANTHQRLPGSFPDIPSPPDSDSEVQHHGKILLSNESPILMIQSASVAALNKGIEARGSGRVDEASFRANIVFGPSGQDDEEHPFAEDTWRSIRIGSQDFKLLGACRRCQMVCVDQQTGEKRQEPYSTLAKTRRFDGKVYFGCHMRHEPSTIRRTAEEQWPTIQVGDRVTVEDMHI